MTVSRLLVANRGEIAVRIVRAAQALGCETVVAVSEADMGSMAARMADRAVCLGPSRASQSYLRPDLLLSVAIGTGCDAVHPGYGFLAENATFARACEDNGIVFVGPHAKTIEELGNKLSARKLAQLSGVPVMPGTEELLHFQDARDAAERIGYPVLIKAAAGGGGRGIRVVRDAGSLRANFESAAAEAEAAFGDGSLFLERFIERSRHVEVQILGDEFGKVVHLGDRDCSTQRRYQKLVEEAPAPNIPESVRRQLHQSAVILGQGIDYLNAGTVEFLYDADREDFALLEINTRIQVEHPVTEAVTGLDLVQLQLRMADGESIAFEQKDVEFSGHAIEVRITAEDPANGFRPSPGLIERWDPPHLPNVRLDTHVEAGYTVPPFYDSLLGKLIVHGVSRQDAVQKMTDALRLFGVQGVATSIPLLQAIVSHDDFVDGHVTTKWLEESLLPELVLDP